MKDLIASLLLALLLVNCRTKSDQHQVVTAPAAADTSLASVGAKNNVPLCGTLTNDKAWYTASRKAPLLTGLSGFHYPITTKSPQAQRYFDQGLLLAYGFNHAEAARSFFEATRLDSTCAACY